MNESTVVSAQIEQVKSIIAGRFNGALSAFQKTAYTDLVHAGLSKGAAHKIASDFGSDLGKLMATDEKFAAKVGKANTSGNSRITLSGGASVATSRAMSTVRVSQQMDMLFKEGLIAERKLPQLSETLTEYVNDSEQWAEEQTWK